MSPVRANMYYYTYTLQSKKDKQWYTGFTVDIRKRLKEHNEGLYESCSVRDKSPLAIADMPEACRISNGIRTGMGKRYLKNRLRRFLALTG